MYLPYYLGKVKEILPYLSVLKYPKNLGLGTASLDVAFKNTLMCSCRLGEESRN